MGFLRDARFSFRQLYRSRTVTAVALLSITLSISATAVVFTAVKSVLIAPVSLFNSAPKVNEASRKRIG
jgi:hypothetical protein